MLGRDSIVIILHLLIGCLFVKPFLKGGDTSASFFGDEDTPICRVILNIEFLEDFTKNCSCGGTVTYIHNSSLSIITNEFSTVLCQPCQ